MAQGRKSTGVHFGGGREQKARAKRRASKNVNSKIPKSFWWILIGLLALFLLPAFL